MAPKRICRRSLLRAGVASGAVLAAGCTGVLDGGVESPENVDPDGAFEIEEVVDGLSNPWGLEFIPGTSQLLVTEIDGQLTLVDYEAETAETVPGTPEVATAGQGGLLDVAIHPAFPDKSWVYLTYAATNEDGDSATHLGRGRLHTDAPSLDAFEAIHVAEPFVDSNGHFGSRVVFGEDGMIYLTTGDRQFKDFGPEHVSQDTTNELGATLRLTPDGSIPKDNPFVDEPGFVDSIYSYGHRNAQGMTVHPETGEIWQSEHSEGDGDEINVIEQGGNYGWPVASEACEYGTDTPVGVSHSERDDVIDPVYYWECGTGGFPPAGMTFYDGESFPDWQGDLFIGNLAGQYLGHFAVENAGSETVTVEERDPLLEGSGWRIRDVAMAPDTGHLYIAIDAGDVPLVRLVPE